jgi:hypothetical protein
MSARPTVVCDECRSPFYAGTSAMTSLCSECAHVLYGHPACPHVFAQPPDRHRHCERCSWTGARSAYLRTLREDE